MKKWILCFTTVFCLITQNAFGVTIDFRDGLIFSAAHNQPSFNTTVNGIGIRLEAKTDTDSDGIPDADALLWWDDVDGLGVQSAYEPDEIEGTEFLVITFTTGTQFIVE